MQNTKESNDFKLIYRIVGKGPYTENTITENLFRSHVAEEISLLYAIYISYGMSCMLKAYNKEYSI